jgi:hypothetical protein
MEHTNQLIPVYPSANLTIVQEVFIIREGLGVCLQTNRDKRKKVRENTIQNGETISQVLLSG